MNITLCGSISFNEEMKKIGGELEAKGCSVMYPESTINNVSKEWWDDLEKNDLPKFIELKGERISQHFVKIEKSEAILVCNYEKRGVAGYIGTNTLMEMAVAFFLNKNIYLLFEPTQDSLREEVIAMNCTQLSGDIHSIFS